MRDENGSQLFKTSVYQRDESVSILWMILGFRMNVFYEFIKLMGVL